MTKTPQMVTGEVEMVSVEWIMQNTTGSVDGFSCDGGPGSVDYQEMLFSKGTDSHFGDIVANIDTYGFRVPIVLDTGYGGPDSLIHGNGHHRMCAAILMCIDEIPVFWADCDYMSSHESDTEELEPFDYWDDLPGLLYKIL